MKIQNYTKSIKIKSQQLSWGKKKKAEVLGRFSRTFCTSALVAQWWKHRWVRAWRTLCLFWLSDGSVHDCGVLFLKQESLCGFLSISHLQTNTPTNPESAAPCSVPLKSTFFFLSNGWEKRKTRGILDETFFSKWLLLAYPRLFEVIVYALWKWIWISSAAQRKVSGVRYCRSTGCGSVVLQCVGLYRRSRVVQCVRVVSRLSS